jgi:hypothetical protein
MWPHVVVDGGKEKKAWLYVTREVVYYHLPGHFPGHSDTALQAPQIKINDLGVLFVIVRHNYQAVLVLSCRVSGFSTRAGKTNEGGDILRVKRTLDRKCKYMYL